MRPRKPLFLHVESKADWRAWLDAHRSKAREVWLVFFKAHTGKSAVAYEEAVEEALCVGWVDSLVKRLDDERYARKFTPRNPASEWSETNRRRVAKLVREGRMTPAGMALVTFPIAEVPAAAARPPVRPAPEPRLSGELEQRLRRNGCAWAAFVELAPWHRRNYVRWIMDGKKEETRLRRLAEAIGLLAEGKKLGLK